MKKYQSYKPSGLDWSGNIPDNWVSSKLKFVLERIVSGGTPDTSNDSFWSNDEDGYSWISISDMTSNPNGIEGTKKKITQSGLENKRLELLPINTLIYSIYGSIGKVNRLKIESTIHQGILGLFPNSKIESRYLEYYLKYIQDFVNILSSSNTQENLNLDKVKNIGIILPPLSEQNQIVQFLDSKTELIDKLISSKERKITLLKEQRTSLVNQVVTKGLNPNVKMKDSGVEWIGEIPEHWNLVSIKHLVSTKITDGPHETPEWVEEGIPFLSVESVQDNKLDFNKKRGFISEELHRIYSRKCKPQRDDIFIVKSGSTTGKSTIVETDEEFNIWSPLCIVRSNKEKVLPYFLFNSIQSFYFRRFVELGWSFGTQPNIGMGVIENIRIVTPPLNEQQPIIDFLDSKTKEIDDLVQLEQKKIDLLKEYRQSLISEVVTGKIKVTN